MKYMLKKHLHFLCFKFLIISISHQTFKMFKMYKDDIQKLFALFYDIIQLDPSTKLHQKSHKIYCLIQFNNIEMYICLAQSMKKGSFYPRQSSLLKRGVFPCLKGVQYIISGKQNNCL